MVVVWLLIAASVLQAGGVTTALVSVPQVHGGHSVTSSASVATAVPVIPRVGCAFVPLAYSHPAAFSLALLASTVPIASLVAIAMGLLVIPRMERASAPQREQDPAVMCPVHRALMASPVPELILAKMEVFLRAPKAPAAAHRAGWVSSVPCPAQRVSMDPTVLGSVDATTVASVTALLGSAIVLLAISGIGARKSAPWAGSGKTVRRPATAALVPAAFPSMVGVYANMASQATAALSASVRMASMVSAARSPAPVTQSTVSAATPCMASAPASQAGQASTAMRAARRTRTGLAARSTASACMAASALQTAASAGVHPDTGDPTVLTYVHPTLTGSTAPPAAPVKMPLHAPPSTARASARKVGSVVTALCPVLLVPGASVAMPVASVPMRESAAPKLEPVLVPLGGMELIVSFPARRDSLVKVVPVSVTVTTLMAATLFLDTADVRLAGWAHTVTCLAQRDFGEPTAATPVPARMGVLVYLKMATVCAHQGSEAPPARSPAHLVAMANAVCPASATTTLPAAHWMGPATVWQAGQAPTALNHVP